MSKPITHEAAEAAEFANMVDLLAVYSAADTRLEEMASVANSAFLEIIDEHRTEYAELQEAMTKAEAALEVIALKHPDWFGKTKSVKTPYGTVKFHASSKLVVKNPELTMLLIEQHGQKFETFKASDYVRETKELNLEALEKWSDAELLKFQITRSRDNNFSVTATKMDMGKAVKSAVEKAAA